MITSAKLSEKSLEISGAEAFSLADGNWKEKDSLYFGFNVTMIPHPLVFECILRHETERLEEFDADILRATAGDGITALQYAAALGSIDCLRILVRRLGVTTADPELFHCCDARFPFGDRQDVLELVLSLNPALDLQSCFDSAAFFGVDWMLSFLLSSQNGESQQRVEMFLEKHGADVNSEDDVHPTTPMMQACWKNHLDCVRMLVEHGADVNARTRVGWSSVAWASFLGHTDCVRFLLEHGAKLGMSLEYAAREGRLDCCRLLLEYGANLTGHLSTASYSGHTDCARLLLEFGADVNLQDGNGWTALMLASRQGHIDFCRLLIDSGADVNVQNVDGQTALSLAEGRGHTDCIALLRQSGAV